MIGIARSDINDRRVLFTNTGDKTGLHPAIIEKDFWVCYVLDYLFHRSEWKDALVFKGGTSLSKAFHVIKRFSEDIDLILDWRLIKYGIDEPWEERSHNQQDKFNKLMIKTTAEYLQSVFVPAVKEGIRKEIGEDILVEMDPDDPDHCTVNIYYPHIFQEEYIRPEIRLEIGPIAEWTPSHKKEIQPFVAENYPSIFDSPSTEILTVDAERTFWEKATILHKVACSGGPIANRYARHYYDMYMLGNSDIKEEAFRRVDLLIRDINFKQKFYYTKKASYDTAVPGSIRLMPGKETTDALRADYEHMKNMFYENAPEWEKILEYLNRLEREINAIEVVTELTDCDGHGNEVLERRIADLKAGRNVHEHELIDEA